LTTPIGNGTITERHKDARRLNKRGIKASNYSVENK